MIMSQGYISEILFHFVGKNLQKEEEQYCLLKKLFKRVGFHLLLMNSAFFLGQLRLILCSIEN